ncbi:MAG: GtrA family protein [Microbacteriaceae bacterium]|jgi:putative flippase GtrA|nr:GtrA family protein [Microbacteriaceae bacterium]HEV7956842.1 GtrA family protein [Marisediminicola sp.]
MSFSTRTRSSVRPQVMRRWVDRFASFGAIGAVAFAVDVGVYNLLRSTLLDDKPIGAKVLSVAVATLVAWIGHRHVTFRRERSRPVAREALLFAVMNVIGLLIAAGCLFVSHYLLGFTSKLADNIAGNGVGLVLGMTFRYLAYHFVVFRSGPTPGIDRGPVASQGDCEARSPA